MTTPKALPSRNELCAAYVDMGTTHTRVWLMQGHRILAQAAAKLGIQDSAKSGSSQPLRSGLRNLLDQVCKEAETKGLPACPRFVLTAGMATSSLGLAEIPHLQAPAGLQDLAGGVQECQFPDITDVPFRLIPGVRTNADAGDFFAADLMRGEETLCMGLLQSGLLDGTSLVLNLGSHWKAILLDSTGRILRSITSLSGELIHAAQTQTILASSLPLQWPESLPVRWLEKGMQEQRRTGLSRAMFDVRLLDLLGQTSPEERFAFLCGAVIASDMDLTLKPILAKPPCIVLAGKPVLSAAWKHALNTIGIDALPLSPQQIETAFLDGLCHVAVP